MTYESWEGGKTGVREAGHTISRRESWLGIQDALAEVEMMGRHQKAGSMGWCLSSHRRGSWGGCAHLSRKMGPHEEHLQALAGSTSTMEDGA